MKFFSLAGMFQWSSSGLFIFHLNSTLSPVCYICTHSESFLFSHLMFRIFECVRQVLSPNPEDFCQLSAIFVFIYFIIFISLYEGMSLKYWLVTVYLTICSFPCLLCHFFSPLLLSISFVKLHQTPLTISTLLEPGLSQSSASLSFVFWNKCLQT